MTTRHLKSAAKPRRLSVAKAHTKAPPESPSGSASKVSVTIDSAVLQRARIAARRSGKTLSAHISQALERDLRRQRMADLIAEFEAEQGVISPEEIAQAIASWQA